MQDFPWVHPHGRRDLGADDIEAARRLLWRGWALLLLAAAALAPP
jgi:adenosylcobinamide-phosphate synthase